MSRFLSLILFGALAACTSHSSSIDDRIPIPARTTESRYAAQWSKLGLEQGELQETRTEHFDARGRVIRWETRDAEGSHQLTWVGVFHGDGPAPKQAGYWTEDGGDIFPEQFVASADGRVVDVLYADLGRKAYRQMRCYYDAYGRELYQEYFQPDTQRRYGEEIYRFDEDGNELGRMWQHVLGHRKNETEFEILEHDEHRRWTKRLVRKNGILARLDERVILDSDGWMERPGAASGPIERSTAILPVPFAPGVISTRGAGENLLSFGPDGRTALFTRYVDDWTRQTAFESQDVDGAWREPIERPGLGTVYNAGLSDDGKRVIVCRREQDELTVAIADRLEGGGFGEPRVLEGFTGSYFQLQADGTLWFHRNGDLFRARLDGFEVVDEEKLPSPISTPDGFEFAAFVDSDRDRLFFTRSVDGSADRSGLFFARRLGESWEQPRKLPLPYGWGARVTPDGEDLVYVIDDDVYRVPLVSLTLPEDGLPR